MGIIVKILVLLAIFAALSLNAAAKDVCAGDQFPDLKFKPEVTFPAYLEGEGPLVVIDEAHHNFHRADGRFRAFAELLRRDGYRVESSKKHYTSFTSEGLAGIDILVVANAVNVENVGVEACTENWKLPTPSAFTGEEIDTLVGWVEEGGSLLVMADHMPFAGAAENLADRFGFISTNGYAFPVPIRFHMKFRPENGSLLPHPVIKGRAGKSEEVDLVVSFTGQGFALQHGVAASPIMVIQEPARSLMPVEVDAMSLADLPSAYHATGVSVKGMYQGVTQTIGRGRLAFFGEAGMFSAQTDGEEMRMGMNNPEAPQNYQFVLNVLHWLSGLL